MTEHRSNRDQTARAASHQHAYGESEVQDYERKRYKGLDQRLVHAREIKILEGFFDRIAPESGPVLDLPCGYGRFSHLFHERRLELVSVDYSFAMVRRTMEQRRDGALRDWGVVADAKGSAPFKEGVFPLVLCMRLWQHVPDRAERRAILDFFAHASSGWAIVSYYEPSAGHRLQRRFRKRLKRLDFMSRQQFADEAGASGFECQEVVPLMRGVHSQHVALLRKAGR